MNQSFEDARGPNGFNGCLQSIAVVVLVIVVAAIFVLGLLAGVALAQALV
jgi:hypothetical protein